MFAQAKESSERSLFGPKRRPLCACLPTNLRALGAGARIHPKYILDVCQQRAEMSQRKANKIYADDARTITVNTEGKMMAATEKLFLHPRQTRGADARGFL
jgi:hypothetical protein